MKKYARIIDAETGLCTVGTGTDISFYESLGMTQREVEKGSDGMWYLAGRAPRPAALPEKVREQKIRRERDRRLNASDYLLMPDYPLSDIDRRAVMNYRRQLRDLPARKGFPWSGDKHDPAIPWPELPLLKEEETQNKEPLCA